MPSVYVKDYDTTVNFPDNTPPEVVQQALQKKFPPIKASQPSQDEMVASGQSGTLRKVGSFIGDVAEGGALTTGELLGIANPIAGVAAGAGAYTAIKGAERGINSLLGYEKPLPTVEEFTQQAKDLKTGTEMILAGGIIGKVISGGYQILKKKTQKVFGMLSQGHSLLQLKQER